ncbi:hypothetical protein FSP39_006296 [Pinctada imbricata]|uniref:cytochrome-b5 reductase n=1 Tax=Pinctada imbricata TaxID=66713 RepID=A0AA88XPC7_PINIB|nr:hypothetical protein FSP39_006296 [Pinctada imbricata]
MEDDIVSQSQCVKESCYLPCEPYMPNGTSYLQQEQVQHSEPLVSCQCIISAQENNPTCELNLPVKDTDLSCEPVRPADALPPCEPLRPPDVILPSEPVRPPDVILPSEPIRPPDVILPSEPVRPSDVILPSEPIRPPDVILPSEPVRPPDVILPSEPVRPSDVILPSEPVSPSDVILPSEPVRPSDSDCCGSGCIPCVFDIYDQEMKIWQRECERIQDKAYMNGDKRDSILLKEEYNDFTIESVTEETATSRRFRVRLPVGRSLGLNIGEHVIIRDVNKGLMVTRQYTPISDVTCKGYFDLIIKIYKEGKMSQCVKSWIPGSVIQLRGPYGEFVYYPNKYRSIQMLAAGTGIAPMAQVIQGILGNEDDDTIIKLHYACRTYKDILMKAELKEWKKYWNFSVIYVLSQEDTCGTDNQYAYGDVVYKGRMDVVYLTSQWEGRIQTDKDLVLVCGTTSFNKDMKKCCTDLGINIDNIFIF